MDAREVWHFFPIHVVPVRNKKYGTNLLTRNFIAETSEIDAIPKLGFAYLDDGDLPWTVVQSKQSP